MRGEGGDGDSDSTTRTVNGINATTTTQYYHSIATAHVYHDRTGRVRYLPYCNDLVTFFYSFLGFYFTQCPF